MKDKISNLVSKSIEKLNVFIEDVYIEEVEGHNILNIVLDSNEVIDLNKVTEASQIINKILDKEKNIFNDIDELDIYAKEKGDNYE